MMNTSAVHHYPLSAPCYRLEPSDRIQIDGVDYAAQSHDAQGYVFFRQGNGADLAISMTHDEIAQRLTAGTLILHRGWFDVRKARQRLKSRVVLLSDLPSTDQQTILWRTEFCDRFLRIEAVEKEVNRSDGGMRPVIARIHDDLQRINALKQGKERRCGRRAECVDPPAPRSLRRWLDVYVSSGCDPMSLRPGHYRSGNRTPHLDAESREFALGHAWRYASLNRPTKALVFDAYNDAIIAENARREREGFPPLSKIGRRSFEILIGRLPVFAVHTGRYGKAAALQKFALVRQGLDILRPLERVEMDEYRVSLQALLVEAGVWSRLSRKLRREIQRARAWLTVAIDCASRCILAMRLLVAPPSAESALSALEMAIYPKDELCDAVGAGSRWEMHGVMETLVTDGGSAFVATVTQVAIRDLGITYEAPPGGLPYLRGTMERFFLTVQSRMLPLFPGQTFENAISRGDYDSEANACLTVEELNRAFIRYAVDIYHNTPHEGLAGETPRNAWQRLTRLYGIVPPPPEHIRTHVFGIGLERLIDNRGIRVLGLNYQSMELQALRASAGKRPVAIRVNRHNLGAISVFQGEGWISVPCSFRDAAGVSVREWIVASQDLRRRYAQQARISEDVVRQAMADLRGSAETAARRAELGEPVLASADFAQAEKELFQTFSFADQLATSEEDLLDGNGIVPFGVPSKADYSITQEHDEFGTPDDWAEE